MAAPTSAIGPPIAAMPPLSRPNPLFSSPTLALAVVIMLVILVMIIAGPASAANAPPMPMIATVMACEWLPMKAKTGERNVISPATTFIKLKITVDMPLMMFAMFCWPILSRICASPLTMRLRRFASAVPIPPVADLAWSANDAKLPVPSLSSRTSVPMKSSMETVPLRSPSPSASVVMPIACATWLSCAGIATCSDRHSIMSMRPLAYDCDNCSMAVFCISIEPPPARMASLAARK